VKTRKENARLEIYCSGWRYNIEEQIKELRRIEKEIAYHRMDGGNECNVTWDTVYMCGSCGEDLSERNKTGGCTKCGKELCENCSYSTVAGDWICEDCHKVLFPFSKVSTE